MLYLNQACLYKIPEPKNTVQVLHPIPQADELLEAVRLLKEHICYNHTFVSDACAAVEKLVAEPLQKNFDAIQKLKNTFPSAHKSNAFTIALALSVLLWQAADSFHFRKDPQFLNKFKKYL